jgi:hypothetical protein
MKIDLDILEAIFGILEVIPQEQMKQILGCFGDVASGNHKYGTIELSIAPDKNGKPVVARVKQIKHFEK